MIVCTVSLSSCTKPAAHQQATANQAGTHNTRSTNHVTAEHAPLSQAMELLLHSTDTPGLFQVQLCHAEGLCQDAPDGFPLFFQASRSTTPVLRGHDRTITAHYHSPVPLPEAADRGFQQAPSSSSSSLASAGALALPASLLWQRLLKQPVVALTVAAGMAAATALVGRFVTAPYLSSPSPSALTAVHFRPGVLPVTTPTHRPRTTPIGDTPSPEDPERRRKMYPFLPDSDSVQDEVHLDEEKRTIEREECLDVLYPSPPSTPTDPKMSQFFTGLFLFTGTTPRLPKHLPQVERARQCERVLRQQSSDEDIEKRKEKYFQDPDTTLPRDLECLVLLHPPLTDSHSGGFTLRIAPHHVAPTDPRTLQFCEQQLALSANQDHIALFKRLYEVQKQQHDSRPRFEDPQLSQGLASASTVSETSTSAHSPARIRSQEELCRDVLYALRTRSSLSPEEQSIYEQCQSFLQYLQGVSAYIKNAPITTEALQVSWYRVKLLESLQKRIYTTVTGHDHGHAPIAAEELVTVRDYLKDHLPNMDLASQEDKNHIVESKLIIQRLSRLMELEAKAESGVLFDMLHDNARGHTETSSVLLESIRHTLKDSAIAAATAAAETAHTTSTLGTTTSSFLKTTALFPQPSEVESIDEHLYHALKRYALKNLVTHELSQVRLEYFSLLDHKPLSQYTEHEIRSMTLHKELDHIHSAPAGLPIDPTPITRYLKEIEQNLRKIYPPLRQWYEPLQHHFTASPKLNELKSRWERLIIQRPISPSIGHLSLGERIFSLRALLILIHYGVEPGLSEIEHLTPQQAGSITTSLSHLAHDPHLQELIQHHDQTIDIDVYIFPQQHPLYQSLKDLSEHFSSTARTYIAGNRLTKLKQSFHQPKLKKEHAQFAQNLTKELTHLTTQYYTLLSATPAGVSREPQLRTNRISNILFTLKEFHDPAHPFASNQPTKLIQYLLQEIENGIADNFQQHWITQKSSQPTSRDISQHLLLLRQALATIAANKPHVDDLSFDETFVVHKSTGLKALLHLPQPPGELFNGDAPAYHRALLAALQDTSKLLQSTAKTLNQRHGNKPLATKSTGPAFFNFKKLNALLYPSKNDSDDFDNPQQQHLSR